MYMKMDWIYYILCYKYCLDIISTYVISAYAITKHLIKLSIQTKPKYALDNSITNSNYNYFSILYGFWC